MCLTFAILAVALAPWQNPQVNSLNRLPPDSFVYLEFDSKSIAFEKE